MSITRTNKVNKLNGLLDIINEKNKELNYHIVYMGGYKYEIVDLKDYGRTIKRGTLDFLIGFCEGFLYIK